MSDNINILDYKENPVLTFRKVSAQNTITRDVSSQTTTFEADISNGRFTVTSGNTNVRFGHNKMRTQTYALADWGNVIAYYQNLGFKFISNSKVERLSASFTKTSKDEDYKPLANKKQQEFLDGLIKAQFDSYTETFSKTIDNIPKNCIDNASAVLLQMQKMLNQGGLTYKEYNLGLRAVYEQIPLIPKRNQNPFLQYNDVKLFQENIDKFRENVEKLAKARKEYDEIVAMANAQGSKSDKTYLETFNLNMKPITSKQKKEILEWLSDISSAFVGGYQISNPKNEEKLNEYAKSRGCTEENGGIIHLFHGTDTENILSIWKNGLYLDPAVLNSNVTISGKAFGYGSYFAPYARKSLGYTSGRGSVWKNGSSRTAYLLIFKVCVGNPYYIYTGTDKKGNKYEKLHRPNHWVDFHKDFPDCDSVWAEKGQSGDMTIRRLNYDEVIVYREDQSSLEYIIELDMDKL